MSVQRRIALVTACSIWFPLHLVAQVTRVRDSAGVQIVENPPRLTAPIAFQIASKPSLVLGIGADIGDREYEATFGNFYAIRLGNGHVAAIDKNLVKYYDSTGRFLGSATEDGVRPLVFANLTSFICRIHGDTLVVFDQDTPRAFTVIDERGVIVRPKIQSEAAWSCFDDGGLLLRRSNGRIPKSEDVSNDFLAVRLDGTTMHDFGAIPIGSNLDMAPGPLGAEAAGHQLYLSSGRSYEVRVLSEDGRLQRIIRTADSLATFTEADFQRRLTQYYMIMISGERRDTVFHKPTDTRPTTWPAYRDVFVGSDGRLWIQDYDHDQKRSRNWTAFDSTGRMLGRLALPEPAAGEASWVLSFGKDEVLIISMSNPAGKVRLRYYPILPVGVGQ